LATRPARRTKEFYFWGITPKPKIGILQKLVCLEASTIPSKAILRAWSGEQGFGERGAGINIRILEILDFH
jgi:hypothetical protein